MAQLGDTIRLVELVSARLCHDLGGLIGTIGGAMEMATEEADHDDEVLAYAASAATALAQRLRLMRAAWGPETGPVPLATLVELVTPALTMRRVELDTRMMPPGCVFPAPAGRVMLNLVLLGCDCLPKPGVIVLAGEPADVFIRIQGPGSAWPPGLASCLHDEARAIAMLTSARSVQMPLTALMALSCGLRLSPVLGAASGVEALRLLTP